MPKKKRTKKNAAKRTRLSGGMDAQVGDDYILMVRKKIPKAGTKVTKKVVRIRGPWDQESYQVYEMKGDKVLHYILTVRKGRPVYLQTMGKSDGYDVVSAEKKTTKLTKERQIALAIDEAIDADFEDALAKAVFDFPEAIERRVGKVTEGDKYLLSLEVANLLQIDKDKLRDNSVKILLHGKKKVARKKTSAPKKKVAKRTTRKKNPARATGLGGLLK